ncbi:MAG: transglutaminase-like domain-containing protein [Bacteroidales bacterium]|jgi:regulator of sirC expression with transglutaminase-like and TPR domain
MDKKELSALINLLDDTDEGVFKQVREKIMQMGIMAIPFLENAWENSFNNFLQNRIENLIHTIQFENIKSELINWKNTDNNNLFNGAVVIAKHQYPEINIGNLQKEIDKITADAWVELNDNLTPLEKVKVLNHIFFKLHGFNGNTTDFHSPQNSYINVVLETKKGNPLLLSIVYSIIAQNLKLPIYGVNLPEHFILGYKNENTLSFVDKNDVLFYINTFNKGTIFSHKEIEMFIRELKLEPKEYFYKTCTNIEIIIRMLHNLIFSYQKLGYNEKIIELDILLGCLSI